MAIIDAAPAEFRIRTTPNFVFAAAGLIFLIVVWQLGVSIANVPNYLLPSPKAIAFDIYKNWALIISNSWITIFEIVLGFFISVLIGVPLAIWVTYSRNFDRIFYPLIVGSQTIPKVALAPLFLAWFGFGLTPKVSIVVLVAFFPILINSVAGFRGISPHLLNLAHSMGANERQIFWKFRLPQALPNIFAGMKLATILSVIGAVVAEFVGADSGLGNMIVVAGSNFQIERQFSAIIVLSLLGTLFFWMVGWLEKKVLPWHVSFRNADER